MYVCVYKYIYMYIGALDSLYASNGGGGHDHLT